MSYQLSAISYQLSAKRYGLWAIGHGLTVLMLGSGCKRGDTEAEVTPRVPVGLAVAATDTLTEVVTVVGRLSPTPGGSALLTAPAPAVVRRVRVQLGARVRPGTLLLELDAPDLLANARTTAAQAEIAERDAARQRELFNQGITSQKQADEKAAEATSARAAATAAAALLARMQVRSPIAGVIQEVAVHPGERVDAGATLAEVIDGTSLDLRAQVPAADLVHLKVGQVAVILTEGVTLGVPAKVAALAPAVDSVSNAGQAVIRAHNPLGTLRSGAAASARIVTGIRREALLVPDSALVVVGDSMSVFVVGTDSVAHARSVGVGHRRGGRAEILRGLKAGERVVSTGAFGLTDGMRVLPSGPGQPQSAASASPSLAKPQ